MSLKVKYITGVNSQGLVLTDADLMLLLFIYEHKLLTQKQAYAFYQMINPNGNSMQSKHGNQEEEKKKAIYLYRAFCNRLNKFEKASLIKRTRYEIVQNTVIGLNLIELHPKGIEVLYLAGLIDNKNMPRIPKLNLEHTMGIKQSVIEALKVVYGNEGYSVGVSSRSNRKNQLSYFLYIYDTEEAYYLIGEEPSDYKQTKLTFYKGENVGRNPRRPYQWPLKEEFISYKDVVWHSYSVIQDYLIERELVEEFDLPLQPDWILSQDENTFDIEFDTGSENIEVLLLKIDNYIELNNLDGSNHTVCIITLDNSIPTRKFTDVQIERISNLKDLLVYPEGYWIVEKDVNGKSVKSVTKDMGKASDRKILNLREEDLNVYVFSLERANAIYTKLLNNDYLKHDEVFKTFYIQQQNNLHLQPASKEEFSEFGLYGIAQFDYPFENIYFNRHNNDLHLLIPVQLKEGDVKSMDCFGYFCRNVMERISGFKGGEYATVVGIYETEDELLHDISSQQVQKYSAAAKLYCIENGLFYDVLTKEVIK